jgi:MYXO-CTERM domain-containing protein
VSGSSGAAGAAGTSAGATDSVVLGGGLCSYRAPHRAQASWGWLLALVALAALGRRRR